MSGGALIEGAYTAAIAASLADRHHVELPITQAVAAIIEGRLGVREAMDLLMTRPITTE
jgi:glycerol-3-phosphate dehydrogenase (NAD(P)+)